MARQQALRGSGRPGGGAVGLRQRFGADLDVWGLPVGRLPVRRLQERPRVRPERLHVRQRAAVATSPTPPACAPLPQPR
jgi:hypothetical protein